jgi:hypothetical protein
MPPARQPLIIPRLSQTVIDKAEHCARLIWFGTSYLTGKPQTSDELLLQEFSRPVNDLFTGQTNSVAFSRSAIHDLMVVGGLKALFRTQHQLDFQQFETFLETNLFSLQQSSPATITNLQLSEFVKNSGKALVSTKVKTNAGYRVALASRILFFALPQVKMFNFSQDLSNALQLQSRPQVAIYNFQEIFDAGLRSNRSRLNKITPPASLGIIDGSVYDENLVNGHWWQRRVLDLAVKLHFNTVTPINPLPPKP